MNYSFMYFCVYNPTNIDMNELSLWILKFVNATIKIEYYAVKSLKLHNPQN